MSAIILSDDELQQIAQRAAAILRETPAQTVEPWLTVDQAAAHMGLSKSQLYTLTSQRRYNGLPCTKEGSRNYYRASELDAWRERQ